MQGNAFILTLRESLLRTQPVYFFSQMISSKGFTNLVKPVKKLAFLLNFQSQTWRSSFQSASNNSARLICYGARSNSSQRNLRKLRFCRIHLSRSQQWSDPNTDCTPHMGLTLRSRVVLWKVIRFQRGCDSKTGLSLSWDGGRCLFWPIWRVFIRLWPLSQVS